MQLLLPSAVNFQVTPTDVNFDSLVRKMYQPKRTFMYSRSPYARDGVSGLGAFVPELCDPMDVACVQRNVAASVANQQYIGEQRAADNYDQCVANGVDPGTCRARWPVGYSGEIPYLNLTPEQQRDQMESPVQSAVDYLRIPNVAQELKDFNIDPRTLVPTGYGTYYGTSQTTTPATPLPAVALKPNQSVPPTTPLTPMQTGFQKTSDVLTQQAAADQFAMEQPAQQSGGGTVVQTKIFGMDQKTFLIAAGIGAVILMMGGRK